MTITTGSFPKGLGGGKMMDHAESEPPTERKGKATDEMAGKKGGSGGDCTKDFMRAQEEGYSPRKAMAAGIIKC